MEGYRNILCATDFSPSSEVALKRASDLAGTFNARLTLLHVVEYFPEDRSNEEIAPEYTDPARFRMSRAREHLAAQAASLGDVDIAQEVRVSEHAAKYEIVRFAEQQQVDLIVVASHGRSGLDALLGATAEGILHRAPCDVLAVRVND